MIADENPIVKLLYKPISLSTFYNYMKMLNFPLTIKESYALNFFLLPIFGDGYKMVLDFPMTDEVIDRINYMFIQQNSFSPLYKFYSEIDPDYDKVMLFCEVYNITRITHFNVYLPLTRDPEHVKMALQLKNWNYIRDSALHKPIICGKCFEYLLEHKLAVHDETTGLFHFDYKILPKNIQEIITQLNLDTKRYLFSREVSLDTMRPNQIERP